MSKLKKEIPLSENKMYYDGVRSLMVSSGCSLLGVYFYAFLLNKINVNNLSFETCFISFVWLGMCFIVWCDSFFRCNRITGPVTKVTYHPVLAKLFLGFSYITNGAFCSLLFDTLAILDDMKHGSSSFAITFWAFVVSLVSFIFCLYVFSRFAIKEIRFVNA